MLKKFLLVCLLCIVPGFSYAAMYQYTDESGVTHFTNIPPVSKKYKVKVIIHDSVNTRKGNYSYLSTKSFFNPSHFDHSIHHHASMAGVDPMLVKAVMKAESNFNPNAVSPKGAQGLMQLMPGTAKLMKVQDPLDPDENIKGGASYLSYLHNVFQGDIELILAAYNAGPMRVFEYNMKVPPYEETKNYIKRVKQYYHKLRNNEG